MEKKCTRKVARSKYENDAPEIRAWWQELFRVLEKDAAIEPHKRLSLLQEVFDWTVLDEILSKLSIETVNFRGDPTLDLDADELGFKKQKIGSESSINPDTKKSFIDKEERELCEQDMGSKESSHLLQNIFGAREKEKPNPYLNFFKRRPDRAAIWRELPPLSLDEMNLNQKAEAITKQIATDFVTWIKTIGGEEESTLTVQSVMEMFEIGMKNNSTTSLRVQLKNMPSVPPKVAEFMKVPEMSKTKMLHREIKKDQRATRRKRQIVAFGSRLPPDMQIKPPDKKAYTKWLSCETIPGKLETMAAVWQGITHLRSTRAFCEYLFYEKPEIRPPKFLIESGMMNPKSFLNKQESDHSIDSFGNVSRLFSLFN